jgi:maltooligosyltrehalose trehalohydrolase
MRGERLSQLVDFETLKLCAALVLLSPYVPLLFMGEEYGEDSPFLYFVSHSDDELVEAVRKGRKEEFASFDWTGEIPDPQSPDTFVRSKIGWEKRWLGPNSVLLNFYRTLIGLRREIPALTNPDRKQMKIKGLEDERLVLMERWESERDSRIFCLFNFNKEDMKIDAVDFVSERMWERRLDSADNAWNGPGPLLPEEFHPPMPLIIRGRSAALYVEEVELQDSGVP